MKVGTTLYNNKYKQSFKVVEITASTIIIKEISGSSDVIICWGKFIDSIKKKEWYIKGIKNFNNKSFLAKVKKLKQSMRKINI